MRQFSRLNVVTFETDERKQRALDGLLESAGVAHVGRLTTVSAFREQLDTARQGVDAMLWVANVVIVGNNVKWGAGPVSSSHVGNDALVSLADAGIAYQLDHIVTGWADRSGRYPETIPAVALGYGEDSSGNAAYERATEAHNVYPFGGGAPARLEYALTAASRVLGLEVDG